MSILDLYWSLSSQRWSLFSFVSVFCVVCHKGENHRVEHRCRSSRSVVQGRLTNRWVRSSHQNSIYLDKFCCGSPMWKPEIFLSSCSLSWELSFVSSQSEYSLWSLLAGRCEIVACIWWLNSLGFWDTKSQAAFSLFWLCRLSGEFVIRGPSP